MRKGLRDWQRVCAIVLAFVILTSPVLTIGAMAREIKVKIPYGTTVNVQFIKAVSPAEYRVGDTVYLTVIGDVKVEGHTVIKSGAKVTAEVTRAKKRNYFGIPAEISVRAKNVVAVDGTLVPIEFSKSLEGEDKYILSIGGGLLLCFLLFLIKGEDAVIPAGTTEIATVVAPVEVTIK